MQQVLLRDTALCLDEDHKMLILDNQFSSEQQTTTMTIEVLDSRLDKPISAVKHVITYRQNVSARKMYQVISQVLLMIQL